MSGFESTPLSARAESSFQRRAAPLARSHPHYPQARTAPAPFPPLVEQALLFGFFTGAAAFWAAAIWWILR